MTRAVVIPASLGAACPPLEMQRRCNEQRCPVDCVLEDWGGWSACSAGCGGGMRERVRSVRTGARHGGRPCGPASEGEGCNGDACDQDCELTSWTAWSLCSKACDGGFQARKRHVLARPKGQGTCSDRRSAARLEYTHCNAHACKPKTKGGVLKCVAKLDVVILLDGSGSLGQAGWDATKRAAKMLIGAFKTGGEAAQVAVLLFSGPSNYDAYKKCTQSTGTVDTVKDCKIIWVSHFTGDVAKLATNVGTLKWPKASTFTSAALATAGAELQNGRPDARSVVITITDGRPMNPRKTFQAARDLRRKARLIWVPVTRHAPLAQIKSWASKPVADNVLLIHDFNELQKSSTVNRILADACPKVE